MAVTQSKVEGFWSENYFPKHEEDRNEALKALAEDSKRRKETPLYRSRMYFPDALAAMARLSFKSNEKHNPGKPMHWNFKKSQDHADCLERHLETFDEIDPETEEYHVAAVVWRACALAQTFYEKRDPELHAKRQAQRDRMAKGEL